MIINGFCIIRLNYGGFLFNFISGVPGFLTVEWFMNMMPQRVLYGDEEANMHHLMQFFL